MLLMLVVSGEILPVLSVRYQSF